MRKLSDAKIADALLATRGNVSAAAARLGCNRLTLYRRLAGNTELSDLVETMRAGIVDMAEDHLAAAVEAGETWAVLFALRTLGKRRGYSTQLDDASASGGRVTVRLIDSTPDWRIVDTEGREI